MNEQGLEIISTSFDKFKSNREATLNNITTESIGQQKVTGDCFANQDSMKNTILQLQNVAIVKRNGWSITGVALWDAGSTLSFITFELARKLQLHGEHSRLEIVTV